MKRACLGPRWLSGRSPATPALFKVSTQYPTHSHCATHLAIFLSDRCMLARHGPRDPALGAALRVGGGVGRLPTAGGEGGAAGGVAWALACPPALRKPPPARLDPPAGFARPPRARVVEVGAR